MRGALAAMLLSAALQAGALDAGVPPRIVGSIGFTGNTLISTPELSRIAGIRVGEPVDDAAFDGAVQRITAAYRSVGNDIALKVAFTPARDAKSADAKTRVEFIIVERQPPAHRGAVPAPAPHVRARSGGVPPPPPPGERR